MRKAERAFWIVSALLPLAWVAYRVDGLTLVAVIVYGFLKLLHGMRIGESYD